MLLTSKGSENISDRRVIVNLSAVIISNTHTINTTKTKLNLLVFSDNWNVTIHSWTQVPTWKASINSEITKLNLYRYNELTKSNNMPNITIKLTSVWQDTAPHTEHRAEIGQPPQAPTCCYPGEEWSQCDLNSVFLSPGSEDIIMFKSTNHTLHSNGCCSWVNLYQDSQILSYLFLV